MIAPVLHSIVSAAALGWALVWLGNLLCKWLLDVSGLSRARDERSASAEPGQLSVEGPNVGKVIGAIERLIIAAGVVFGSWEIMAAVVALKSVARFKELDQKLDAEYFLVGSLFSLAWAGLIAKAWVIYDHCFGLDIAARLA